MKFDISTTFVVVEHGYLRKTTKQFKHFFFFNLMEDQQISIRKRKTKAYFSFRPFPNWVFLRFCSDSQPKEFLEEKVAPVHSTSLH